MLDGIVSQQPQQPDRTSSEPSRTFTEYSTIQEKVKAGFERGKVVMLFTDIDATLVLGSGHHQHEIDQGQRTMVELIKALNASGIIIVPITGSHFDSGTSTTNSVLNRIERGLLPQVGASASDPLYAVDAYVADGGAKAVQSLNGREVRYDPIYMASVQPESLNYDLLLSHAQALANSMNQKGLSDAERQLVDIYDAHAGHSKIFLQPGTENGTHRDSNKVAFYFYACSLKERDQIEESFSAEAKRFGMNVVCCEEKDANTAARRHPTLGEHASTEGFPLKYCLDIVPFDKGSAVRHFSEYVSHLIAEHAVATGKERPMLEVWACGDSGNDLPLMSSSIVTNAVIVGGASNELIRLGDRLKEHGKSVYIETDPSKIGPASIAHAILESNT